MSNDMWHVALEPGTTKMQDVISASISIGDIETISMLLSSTNPKAQDIEVKDGGYLLMYGGEYERPYPSVMIWRYRKEEENAIIEDMKMEDAWIVECVWRKWLMPEDADAEYVPPKQFLVMQRKGYYSFYKNNCVGVGK
jgi:hypothetical protein